MTPPPRTRIRPGSLAPARAWLMPILWAGEVTRRTQPWPSCPRRRARTPARGGLGARSEGRFGLASVSAWPTSSRPPAARTGPASSTRCVADRVRRSTRSPIGCSSRRRGRCGRWMPTRGVGITAFDSEPLRFQRCGWLTAAPRVPGSTSVDEAAGLGCDELRSPVVSLQCSSSRSPEAGASRLDRGSVVGLLTVRSVRELGAARCGYGKRGNVMSSADRWMRAVMARAGMGLAKQKPWQASAPSLVSAWCCSTVSTPSATTVIPRPWAS